MKNIIKIVKGNVEIYNVQTMNKVRTVYSGGDAQRADWYQVENESVQVQLFNGKLKIFNRHGNLIRTM
jgi:hypothetical protein